jgi:hypothetical protein
MRQTLPSLLASSREGNPAHRQSIDSNDKYGGDRQAVGAIYLAR